jgi:hypothetical protein
MIAERSWDQPHLWLGRSDGPPPGLIRDDVNGHYRIEREQLLVPKLSHWGWRQEILAWMRDHVNHKIPRWYYNFVLGHDLHVSTFAQLHVKHFHAHERDPFTGEMGWLENVGLVSQGKVTSAFINYESLMLVTDSTVIGDFKYHETGTSATAEANTDTALVTTAITGSLAARVAGTQTNPTSPTYQSVATLTATGSATWQEHGLFSAATGVTLMDRSLISPTVAVVSSDTVQFTYTLTKTPEP